MANQILTFGTTTVSQFLLARQFGVSLKESAIYCAISSITAAVACEYFKEVQQQWRCGILPTRFDSIAESIKMKQYLKEQTRLDLARAHLISYVLGWVAVSFGSALNDYPHFKPLHMGTTFVMGSVAFGIHSLVLLASKEFDIAP